MILLFCGLLCPSLSVSSFSSGTWVFQWVTFWSESCAFWFRETHKSVINMRNSINFIGTVHVVKFQDSKKKLPNSYLFAQLIFVYTLPTYQLRSNLLCLWDGKAFLETHFCSRVSLQSIWLPGWIPFKGFMLHVLKFFFMVK